MKMLAANLKLLREQHRLTQKQVADALNIERSTYTYYERGRTLPTFSTICKLARIFDVSIDALAGLELPAEPTASDTLLFGEGGGATYALHQRGSLYRVSNPLASLPDPEQNLLLKFRQLSPQKKEELMKQLDKYLEELSMD